MHNRVQNTGKLPLRHNINAKGRTSMLTKETQHIQGFWVAGINYKKPDAAVRGLYAVSNEQYEDLLSLAPEYGLKEFFVLSTCNRTEIYAVANSAKQLADLLLKVCQGNEEAFSQVAYFKNGGAAIRHLFEVAAGLDSQILGDFEILGQIKMAVKQAKARGFIGAFMERLLNSVMQSSKAVKTNTALSGGTVSVSFAAVQYIKQTIENVSSRKIVVAGTGKIGRTTCKNLVHYLDTHNITLINRTYETADNLATALQLHAAHIENLADEVSGADIIIVSTNASEPVLLKQHLAGKGPKLVIDLSVPCNVEKDAGVLEGVTLVDVDTLSKIKDETLENRKAEVPKALGIIETHIAEFNEWYAMRRHVPVLKEVKNKLKTIYVDASLLSHNQPKEETIQNVINVLATKMRKKNAAGCHYIEAINDFIAYHE